MDFRADPVFNEVTDYLEQSRGLPKGLLTSLVHSESGGNPNAVSNVGARGLTQFMPETAKQYKVNVNDPVDSLRGAADYLQDLIHQYDGNVNAALAHYNGGAYNARYQMDGTAPAPNKVSPQNFETNKKYVSDITSRLDPSAYVGQVNAYVTNLAKSGAGPDLIVNQLMKNPATAELVKQGRAAGESSEQIVATLGGASYQPIAAARQKIAEQGFATNVVQGGANAVGDMVQGAKQVGARVTGDNIWLKQLQEQQKSIEDDPERRELDKTVGGMVGSAGVKALPYVAAGVATGGAATPLILGQTAAGAASGAFTPTTQDGQFARNIGTEALLGGATSAVTLGAGKLFTKGFNKVAGADDAAERIALMKSAEQQGLPVSASNISPFWRGISDGMPNNGSVKAAQQLADDALTTKIAEGVGLSKWSGSIDSDLLNTARPAIQRALDDATNVTVKLPQAMKSDLSTLLNGTANPLTDGIANNSTVTKAIKNLTKAIERGTAVSGRDLQGLNSELKELVQTQGVSNAEKRIASQLIGKVNQTLTSAMNPEQQAAYAMANKQYANLKAVEKMVAASNDTGIVSPRQILQAAKTGRFKNAFLKGDAPYQELGSTAAELYGPANKRGLGDVIAKSVGGSDGTLAAASVIEPVIGLPALAGKKAAQFLLGKMATSQNPAVVKLLTGTSGAQIDPAMASYIAKALSAGAGSQ
jgi:hypothetical protein